jgi:hypothetical protein
MQFVTIQVGHGFEGWIGQLVDGVALDLGGWDSNALADTSALLNQYVDSESVIYEAVEQILLLLAVIPAPLKKLEALPWVSRWLQPDSETKAAEVESSNDAEPPVLHVPPLQLRKHLKTIHCLRSLKVILKENHIVTDYVVISVGKSLRKPEGSIVLDAKALFGSDSLLELFSAFSGLDTSHLHRIASADGVRLLVATIGAPETDFGVRSEVEAAGMESDFSNIVASDGGVIPFEEVWYPLPVRCESTLPLDVDARGLSDDDYAGSEVGLEVEPWEFASRSPSTSSTTGQRKRPTVPRRLLRRQRSRPCVVVGQPNVVALFNQWHDMGCHGSLVDLFRSGNQPIEEQGSDKDGMDADIQETSDRGQSIPEDPATCKWFEVRPSLKPIPSSVLFEATNAERGARHRRWVAAEDSLVEADLGEF